VATLEVQVPIENTRDVLIEADESTSASRRSLRSAREARRFSPYGGVASALPPAQLTLGISGLMGGLILGQPVSARTHAKQKRQVVFKHEAEAEEVEDLKAIFGVRPIALRSCQHRALHCCQTTATNTPSCSTRPPIPLKSRVSSSRAARSRCPTLSAECEPHGGRTKPA
jgi:hypothetical protein